MNRRKLLTGMGAGAIAVAVPSITVAATQNLEFRELEAINNGLCGILAKNAIEINGVMKVDVGHVNNIKRDAEQFFKGLVESGKIARDGFVNARKENNGTMYDISFHYLKRHAKTFDLIHHKFTFKRPVLSINDFIGLQPMTGPTGIRFALRPRSWT